MMAGSAAESALVKKLESWADLPLDVLFFIMLRLGSKDRSMVRSVCKSWHLLNPRLWMLCFYEKDLSPICKSPCLMLHPDTQISLPLELLHTIFKDFPELNDGKVHFSSSGWLLVCCDDASMFFFNPFTLEKMKVPPYTATATATKVPAFVDLSSTPMLLSGSFSRPPTHPNCCLCIIYRTSNLGIIGCGTLNFGRGDKYWYYTPMTHLTSHGIILTSPPIVRRSCIYCMDRCGNVFVIDRFFNSLFYKGMDFYMVMKYTPPSGKKVIGCYIMLDVDKDIVENNLEETNHIRVDIIPIEHPMIDNFIEDKFQDYGGDEFLAVFVLEDSIDNSRCVLVNKLKFDILHRTYVWKSVTSLGNKCLYLGNNGSFWVEAGEGTGDANTIYFNYLDGKNAVSYSLSGEANFTNYSSQLGQRGIWIQPSWE